MHRRLTPKTEAADEGNNSDDENREGENGNAAGQSKSRRNVPTRACTIPLVRINTLGHLDEERMRKLENRLELVEGHCRLLRRRVRALEMERTEDIKRVVLQTLNNQKFTISTSFPHEDFVGATTRRPASAIAQDPLSSSSEEEEVKQPKIKIQSKRKLPPGPPSRKAKRRQIATPDPLKHLNNSRGTISTRASNNAVSKRETKESADQLEESEQVIIPESFENTDADIGLIGEGDVSLILEDYDDIETAEEYVTTEETSGSVPIPTKFSTRRRRTNSKPADPKKTADILKKRRREMMCLINRTYTCSVCDKAFKSKWEMERHSLTHNRDQCYKCPSCPKTYTQKTSVNRHFQRWHTGKIEDHEDGEEDEEVE